MRWPKRTAVGRAKAEARAAARRAAGDSGAGSRTGAGKICGSSCGSGGSGGSSQIAHSASNTAEKTVNTAQLASANSRATAPRFSSPPLYGRIGVRKLGSEQRLAAAMKKCHARKNVPSYSRSSEMLRILSRVRCLLIRLRAVFSCFKRSGPGCCSSSNGWAAVTAPKVLCIAVGRSTLHDIVDDRSAYARAPAGSRMRRHAAVGSRVVTRRQAPSYIFLMNTFSCCSTF